MLFILGLIALYIGFYITAPFIVLSHELGHAFAHLLLSKQEKIDVFVGSYEDENSLLKFRVGKLHFFIKWSFLLKGYGCCRTYTQELNYKKRIAILLAGSISSVSVSIIISVFVFNSEMHGAIKLFCFGWIIFSMVSLFMNLKSEPTQAGDIDNDGKQLSFTWKIRKVYSEYYLARIDVIHGAYENAAIVFRKTLVYVPDNVKVIRELFEVLMAIKNYTEAEELLVRLERLDKLTCNERINWGYIQSITNRREPAIINYRLALKIDADNVFALNNMAYELMLSKNYAEGKALLEKVITTDPDFGYAYSNLGYIEVMTNNLDAGKALIDKSLEMEPGNAYAYKHLGIYYLKTQNKELAESNFAKARELDKFINVDDIDTELLTLKAEVERPTISKQ